MYSISFQDDISMMPRERLMREGAEKLSNQELLSIFLRTGNKKETVFQVSQRILSSISSLNDLKCRLFLESVRLRLWSCRPLSN